MSLPCHFQLLVRSLYDYNWYKSSRALHGQFRGGKYSLYEGGTRVPFITYWRNRIPAGVSDAVVSQTDLLASLTALAGVSLPSGSSFDSLNTLPVLMGQSKHGRGILIEADAWQRTAIREGKWKLLDLNKPGSPSHAAETNFELYDLVSDPGETTNVASQHPDVVQQLTSKLQQIHQASS
jgi:arylsulfatase A-like enzyme